MPKFLERQQQQGGSKHLRGASMTQAPPASKLVGSHAFLSQQYHAVVQQQNGEPTNEQTRQVTQPSTTMNPPNPPNPPNAPNAPNTPKRPNPPKRGTRPAAAASGHAPRPGGRRTQGAAAAAADAGMTPLSGAGALAAEPGEIAAFLGKVRAALVLRRHTGASAGWCEDLDLVLREAKNVLRHLERERQKTAALSGELEEAAQRAKRMRSLDGAASDELVQAQDQIAKQKGQLARLQAEVQSTQILLSDEQQRSARLHADRKEAQKAELAAMELGVHKAESARLAGRVAVLESDNAILMAEKAQWLGQLKSENEQLQELFEDARSAKDVMVRELNAVDKERHELAKMRLDLAHQLEYVGASGYGQDERAKHEEELAATEGRHDVAQEKIVELEAEVKRLVRLVARTTEDVASAQSDAKSARGAVHLTEAVFDKMSQASLKFHKLEARLKRRQGKMSVVFDAGVALFERYRVQGDTADAQRVVGSLMRCAMSADEALLAEAAEQQANHEDAVDIVQGNANLGRVADEFRERLNAQTGAMRDGIVKMGRMFVDAFNRAQEGKQDNAALTRSMMAINTYYDALLATALEAGGSHSHVALDVDEELTFHALHARSKEDAAAGGGAGSAEQEARIATLEGELAESRAEQQRLNEVRSVLVANITNTKTLLKRYKKAVAQAQQTPAK
jgi:hypothetical protein